MADDSTAKKDESKQVKKGPDIKTEIQIETEQKQGEPPKSEQKDPKDIKIEELTNALARAMADLQNYKRRTEEDQGKFVKFANAELLKILLAIIDNFNRSVGHLPEDLKKNDWAKGIVQIHDDFLKTLEKVGVKKIKTVGEKLDPKLHEGLIAGPGEKDVILEELEPGYTLNGDVIKVAKVKVGDGTK
jgi:molecular chaperone GrpE